MVTSAEGGEVRLGKPLRLIELDAPSAGLYSDGFHAVVASGAGYSIKTLRDGRIDEKIFATPDAAKNEILRRKPTQVGGGAVANA